MVQQIKDEGVPLYTDTIATEKSNHSTVVLNYAKSSKRINTFLREMLDTQCYSKSCKALYI